MSFFPKSRQNQIDTFEETFFVNINKKMSK